MSPPQPSKLDVVHNGGTTHRHDDGADSLPAYHEAQAPNGNGKHSDVEGARSVVGSVSVNAGARQRTEHVYSLTAGGKNKPWIFLKVHSRAPSEKSLPIFLGKETITGHVELDLVKTEHIQGISLTLKGETLQVGQEPIPFLSKKKMLWSIEIGDPNSKSQPEGSGSGSKVKEGNPKLIGKYSWPFEMELPDHVEASSAEKGPTQTYLLPPSFTERASPAYIDYKIVVTVHRGRFRIDNTLGTSFGYIPQHRAPPSTELRHAAYVEGGQMAGPEADPDGWHVLEPISIQGTLFESRTVEIQCTLSIGKPHIYALNSPIPLWIVMKSTDTQALDVLSAPASIRIILRRSLAIGVDAVKESRDPRTETHTRFDKEIGQAVIWPLQDTRKTQSDPPNESEAVAAPELGGTTRVLEGEIYVKSNEKPSFVFPRATMRHFVDLLPLAAVGFVSSETPPNITPGTGPRPLVSKQVELVALSANGSMRSRAPPGYSNEQAADYNTAIAMLTAANQRFIHIHHGMS